MTEFIVAVAVTGRVARASRTLDALDMVQKAAVVEEAAVIQWRCALIGSDRDGATAIR